VTTFVTPQLAQQGAAAAGGGGIRRRDDCVIVATSVLELGGSTSATGRVIQIDSPATVSSLLHRMGRTGADKAAPQLPGPGDPGRSPGAGGGPD